MFLLIFNVLVLSILTILFLLLIWQRDNMALNKLLAYIIIIPAFNIVSNLFLLSGYISIFPYIIFLSGITVHYFPILIYIYSRKSLNKKTHKTHPFVIITLTAITLTIFLTIDFYRQPNTTKQAFLNIYLHNQLPWQVLLIMYVLAITLLLYLSVALIEVLLFTQKLKNNYSNLQTDITFENYIPNTINQVNSVGNISARSNFLQQFILFMLICSFVLIIVSIFAPIQHVLYFWLPFLITIISVYIFYKTFYLPLKNISAGNINTQTVQNNEPLISADNNNTFEDLKNLIGAKKRQLKISNDELNKNAQLISQYLESKPYLLPNFDLNSLSGAIKLSSHVVSYTINVKFEMNFFDFINSYRIRDAKKILDKFEREKRTIESVGYDVGFNTKSAFYRAFNKHCKLTPSEYLNTKNVV